MALGPCLPPRGHSMHTCDASLAAPAPPQVDMFQKPPKFP
eukprot:CAMPEP_0119417302 /NCGR_PEP_ID=MMETSP1335-20130426/15436_1 /TAXON_ID=259385 /ORGANISM="Chrysoculter rhomboideus, Strain RCC1486" /LENGTH=39 /DNA_ID= /DNA_START= /DNA_END= /DNA_ORIENTATION=